LVSAATTSTSDLDPTGMAGLFARLGAPTRLRCCRARCRASFDPPGRPPRPLMAFRFRLKRHKAEQKAEHRNFRRSQAYFLYVPLFRFNRENKASENDKSFRD
jgi:hypothetical protein